MITLKAGTYLAPSAELSIQLPALSFPESSWIAIRGDNGAGKTTLLEHIILPQLRLGHHVLYLAQDFDLQLHAIRATLGLLNQSISARASHTEIALAWLDCAPHASILMTDEFDKYLPAHKLYAALPPSVCHVFAVSHLRTAYPQHHFTSGFELMLERHQRDATTVTGKQLW